MKQSARTILTNLYLEWRNDFLTFIGIAQYRWLKLGYKKKLREAGFKVYQAV